MSTYEYRVCVADEAHPNVAEDHSGEMPSEAEAREVLGKWLSPDFAQPPYELGWIERRPRVEWERIP